MNQKSAIVIALLLVSFCQASEMHVTGLTCEYQRHPVGIDCDHPRLSWILESSEQDQVQTAYQILVASKPNLLTESQADCWNSGKVETSKSLHVTYAGKPLQSLKPYYWKVRAWDKSGQASEWSSVGRWTTGWMDPTELKGKWITYTKPLEHEVYKEAFPVNFKHAKWLWRQVDVPLDDFGAEELLFRRMIKIENVHTVKSALILVTADDSFQLRVNGTLIGSSESWSIAKDFELRDALKTGANLIEIQIKNTSIGAGGMICSLTIEEPAKKTEIVSDSQWQVRRLDGQASEPFAPAKEIGAYGDSPWNQVGGPGQDTFWTQKAPSPLLRKEFELSKKIASAYATVSGLGFYELRLNGQKVGDKVMDPLFTNYDKTVFYSTYDISKYVTEGNNAVGIMLGNGFYNSHTRAAWNFDSAPWRDRPKAMMDIVVTYADGTSEQIETDMSWTASNGPLVADAIRSGEVYDARLEQSGWDQPGFNASTWEPVAIASTPKGTVRSEFTLATKVHKTIKPIAITEPKEGVYLLDMGVNIAGWATLKLRGQRGQKITLRYGEVVTDGQLDQENIKGLTLSGPFQTDTYYCKGQGVEEWHPRFVYHGFRYVEVTGLDKKPSPEMIQAQTVYTDFETIGSFTCSNALFNKIQDATERSYQSNYIGIPTDCPQREKNGWTADAHLAAEQAMFNFDNVSGYEKWLGDIRDDQDEQGRYSCIIPTSGWGGRGDTKEWDSAYMIIAWYLYLYRDDVKVIEDHYENMKRYIAHVVRRVESEDYIITFGLGDWANDGGSKISTKLSCMGYFYYDNILMEKFANILGKEEDAKYFAGLAEKIKTSYNRELYKGHGIYDEGQQTASAMSLFYGLVPPSEREAVEQTLLKAIKEKNDHHDTGILGAKCIYRVLADMDQTDLAMTMLNQKTWPSYGYWFENGATSLYETWDKDASSLNHIMFGDISAWFYSYLAGIQADPTHPGFKHFTIQPKFMKGLDWIQAQYRSPYGRIKVDWQINGSTFDCHIQVPVNTQATVTLESSQPQSVQLAGNKAKNPQIQNGKAIYKVGSGHYRFTGRK